MTDRQLSCDELLTLSHRSNRMCLTHNGQRVVFRKLPGGRLRVVRGDPNDGWPPVDEEIVRGYLREDSPLKVTLCTAPVLGDQWDLSVEFMVFTPANPLELLRG